jgi:predicted  nucleic acid-binding Zn-ribbon protein
MVLAFASLLLAIVPFITSCGYSDEELQEYDDAEKESRDASANLEDEHSEFEGYEQKIARAESELESLNNQLDQAREKYNDPDPDWDTEKRDEIGQAISEAEAKIQQLERDIEAMKEKYEAYKAEVNAE